MTASIARIKGSDGSANASQMTVQTIRAAGAGSILTNTVSGVPPQFYATMGTPHTFTDPVTSETITVISEATAVDFAGHVNSGHLEIDAIAPGYTDLGSAVGDIVIIRPITEWANNIFNVLNAVHNDDGTLKNDSISSDALFVDAVDPVLRASEIMFDHIASGGVLAGLGYGSTLTASLSAGVCYINGNRQLIAGVATRAYTANKDTYVDLLYNSSGTATVVYTEVANNAASPALAANSIRLGIVVTGATNIAAAGSINQGQENCVLPITSSTPYQVTDSLGNLICPRDSARKLLGRRQIVSNDAQSGQSLAAVPGLSCPVIIPTGRKIKLTIYAPFVSTDNSGSNSMVLRIFDTSIAGTQITQGQNFVSGANNGAEIIAENEITPTSSSKTYIGGLSASAGNPTLGAGATYPAFIKVELA